LIYLTSFDLSNCFSPHQIWLAIFEKTVEEKHGRGLLS
jgi:hypothetical protein